jgi:hypothetical protein
MRIVLLYPPPWKIPDRGAPPDRTGDGPPAGFAPGDIDADFWQIPYGLLSLAAQALRAGHAVKVLNLSAFGWSRVEQVLSPPIDAALRSSPRRSGAAIPTRTWSWEARTVPRSLPKRCATRPRSTRW